MRARTWLGALLGLALVTPGTAVAAAPTWYLRNANSNGPAEIGLQYGNPGDTPIAGDWNGDGVDTPGVTRRNAAGWMDWYLRNANSSGVGQVSFAWGNNTDRTLVGDWNGDGIDTPAVTRADPAGWMDWYLKNANDGTWRTGDRSVPYGNGAGDVSVVGDWNADGIATPGVYRRSNATFYLADDFSGRVVASFRFGTNGNTDDVLVGDWNGDGYTSIGLFRRSTYTWTMSNYNGTGYPAFSFQYGNPGDYPVVGDWDGNGTDTPGVVRLATPPPSDATLPDVELGGELYDERAEPLTGDGYDVWVDTDDSGTGVTTIQILVDGRIVSSTSEPCAGGACSLEHEWTFERAAFATGSHTVRVRVIDGALNVATRSFTVNLSATQTDDEDDPARDTSASDFTAYSEATTGAERCDGLGRGLGADDPVDVASEDLAFYRETSFAYDDGSYLVIRCEPSGSLIEAQHVAPFDTPSGTLLVPESTTLPGDEPDTYETLFPAYADPEEPEAAAAWQRDGAAAAGRVLEPTPGVTLTSAAAPQVSELKCSSDRKPQYNFWSWGRGTWYYHVREDTIPVEFNSPRNITRVKERIRNGAYTWNTTKNSCHRHRLRDRFYTAIRPNETDRANAGFVEFVPDNLPCGKTTGDHGTIIGCTHVDTSGTTIVTAEGLKQQAIKANIRFLKDDTQRYWIRKKTDGCLARTDLWALAAHEVGHVVGLRDLYETSNRRQSMYGIVGDCVFSHRSLGRADFVGFKRLYLP